MSTAVPSPRQQVLIDHYLADPARNATAAARKAGYKNPRHDGSRIVRRFRELIEQKDSERQAAVGLKADQVLAEIAGIATDPTHKDRLRALELLAKMHGLMSDKPVSDKKTLQTQLEELLKGTAAPRAESKSKTAKPKLVLVRTA